MAVPRLLEELEGEAVVDPLLRRLEGDDELGLFARRDALAHLLRDIEHPRVRGRVARDANLRALEHPALLGVAVLDGEDQVGDVEEPVDVVGLHQQPRLLVELPGGVLLDDEGGWLPEVLPQHELRDLHRTLVAAGLLALIEAALQLTQLHLERGRRAGRGLLLEVHRDVDEEVRHPRHRRQQKGRKQRAVPQGDLERHGLAVRDVLCGQQDEGLAAGRLEVRREVALRVREQVPLHRQREGEGGGAAGGDVDLDFAGRVRHLNRPTDELPLRGCRGALRLHLRGRSGKQQECRENQRIHGVTAVEGEEG